MDFRTKKNFEDFLDEKKKKALDASGSIREHDFKLALELCEALVKYFSNKTSLGVLQFASQAKVEFEIQSDKRKLSTEKPSKQEFFQTQL